MSINYFDNRMGQRPYSIRTRIKTVNVIVDEDLSKSETIFH